MTIVASNAKVVALFVSVALSICSFGGAFGKDESVLAESSSRKQPRLRVKNTVYDFGDVWQGEELECFFEIFNDGQGDLIILDQTTTCGCTASKPMDRVVPPGNKQNLFVSFETRRIVGRTTKKVMLHTNDPRQTQTILSVLANVRPTVEVMPSTIEFGIMSTGVPITKNVSIKRKRGDGPIRIKEIRSSSNIIRVEKLGLTEYGCDLAVSLSPLVAQRISETLEIVLDGEKLSRAYIPIKATAYGMCHVEPQRLFYGFVKPCQLVKKKVVVIVPPGEYENVSIYLSESRPRDDVQQRVIGDIREGSCEIEVTWTPGVDSTPLKYDCVIVVTKDGSDVEVTRIPCYGLLSK